jgi:hypothetical protein
MPIKRETFVSTKAKALTRDVLRKKLAEFRRIIETSTGEHQKKARRHLSWYKARAKKLFGRSR